MFQKKRYLYLSEAEYSILVKSLIQLKNKLIQLTERHGLPCRFYIAD